MNKNTYITLAVILLALIALVFVQKKNSVAPTTSENATTTQKLVTGTDQETFSGTITAVDTGCFSDATCSVTVDGKKIVLVTGGRGVSPDVKVGKLLGVNSVGDLEQKIGAHANVFATTTPDGNYSIYGNENYYVEVVVMQSAS